MNAISIHEPWASLIILGYKRVETRSWRPPAHCIGKPLLIHAGKFWSPAYDDLIGTEPFKSCLEGHDLPRGMLLGVATLSRSDSTNEVQPVHESLERAFGDYRPNRHGWLLTDVLRFIEPVPYRGMQGIFQVPDEVVADAISSAIPPDAFASRSSRF